MFSKASGSLRRRGGGGGSGAHTVPLKGLFADGIWQCNCTPRLPAEHFQTKNGGRNHGRWFYTCQKPQPSRCGFFLWDDEARPREAGAVLLNARSEAAAAAASTPTQPRRASTPSTPSHARATATPPEEFYDWPPSAEEEDGGSLAPGSPSPSQKRMPRPLSPPRKAPKTEAPRTPGKRAYGEMAFPTPSTAGKLPDGGDVFTTPTTAPHGRTLFSTASLPSPATTPTPQRFRAPADRDAAASALEREILDALRESGVGLGADAQAALRGVCERWELRLRGVQKGREVVRAAVRRKEERIGELVGRVEGLEREREAGRAVVRSLRGGREGDGGVG
ncbi:hypothetical protein MMC18_000945 [Xylographa bjoerkii]|nr:hypothetical protein [Xylographa bjoerkii]